MTEIKQFQPNELYNVSAIATILKKDHDTIDRWMKKGYAVKKIIKGQICRVIIKLPYRYLGRLKNSYGFEINNFFQQINS